MKLSPIPKEPRLNLEDPEMRKKVETLMEHEGRTFQNLMYRLIDKEYNRIPVKDREQK